MNNLKLAAEIGQKLIENEKRLRKKELNYYTKSALDTFTSFKKKFLPIKKDIRKAESILRIGKSSPLPMLLIHRIIGLREGIIWSGLIEKTALEKGDVHYVIDRLGLIKNSLMTKVLAFSKKFFVKDLRLILLLTDVETLTEIAAKKLLAKKRLCAEDLFCVMGLAKHHEEAAFKKFITLKPSRRQIKLAIKMIGTQKANSLKKQPGVSKKVMKQIDYFIANDGGDTED